MSVSLAPFGEQWIVDYFTMVDTRDVDEFLRWYGDDSSFRFANQEPAQGKIAIRKALEQFYGLISSMHHEKTGVWANADSGAFEAIAHFVTKDGRNLALPAVSTLRVRNGSCTNSASLWTRHRSRKTPRHEFVFGGYRTAIEQRFGTSIVDLRLTRASTRVRARSVRAIRSPLAIITPLTTLSRSEHIRERT